MKHDKIDDLIFSERASLLQFVSDNTDHDLATIDGKKTHHGLGSIAIANGSFTNAVTREKIPREKKENWANIQATKGIEINEYLSPNIPALSETVLLQVEKVWI